ncbi:hypothetical protein [Litchfieldia alkalitelluris]|uniref:hypothetical protein n=1 Tax=Litchfieldia alkalitelluris TaxID=304268 RepID=UPI0011171510|nr:hypothetical protein [Litchfieldia alkalitelluris]
MAQNESKLSEVEVTSGSFGPEQNKVVRSEGNFRQLWPRTNQSCPKGLEVQTALAQKKAKLSEEVGSSDSFGPERIKAVRSGGNFRQLWPRTKQSCPK